MPLTLTEAISDTLGVTDSVVGRTVLLRSLSDTVGVTDVLSRQMAKNRAFSDTVGITDSLSNFLPRIALSNTVGISDLLVVHGILIQFDTWRPVPKPDNTLVMICRSPVGEHDTYTGRTHCSLWTIRPDGTSERPAVLTPATNGFGWVSFSHPEWSPDGNEVVLAVETSTTYKLMFINSSGFGA